MKSDEAKVKYLAKSMGVASIAVIAIGIVFIIIPFLFGSLTTFVYETLTSTVTHSLLSGVSVWLGVFVLIVNITYCLLQAGNPFSRLELSVAAVSNIALGFLLYPGIYIYLSSEVTADWWHDLLFTMFYTLSYIFLLFIWVRRAFA